MNREATIEDLPNEMLTKIFSYIKEDGLALNVRHVSQRWQGLIDETKSLWRDYTLQVDHHMGIEDIISLIENMPLLKGFDSYFLCVDGDEILNKLVSNCRVLTVLKIPCLKISADCAELIIEGFPCLSELRISLNSEMERQIKAVSRSSNLVCLHLMPYSEASGQNTPGLLVPLAEGCPKLSALYLYYISHDTEDINNLLTKKKNKLECLGWIGPMHSSTFVRLGEFTVLKILNIGNFCLTDVLPTSDNIPVINLPSIENVVYLDSPIEYLSTLTFASLPSLNSLRLRNCSGDVTTVLSFMFPRCQNLQNLCLNHVVVDENVFTLIQSRVLKSLCLDSCKYWGLPALRHIKDHCRMLTELSIIRNTMTAEMGTAIFSLYQLEDVCFSDCNLVSMDFRFLCMNSLPNLKKMTIKNCQLYSSHYNHVEIAGLRRQLSIDIS